VEAYIILKQSRMIYYIKQRDVKGDLDEGKYWKNELSKLRDKCLKEGKDG